MNPAAVLGALTLLVGVPLNYYVTRKLWRLSAERPDLRVLRERAIVSTAVLLIVFVFSLVFFSNDSVPPILGSDITKIVTRVAILALAVVPATYWLRIYR